MNTPLYTFQPDLGDSSAGLWIGSLAAVAALAGVIALLRRKGTPEKHNARMLWAMLLFFLFLISLGVAFFSGWGRLKTGPVMIYSDAVETPYGRVAFSDIRDARIQQEGRRSLVDPTRTIRPRRLLIIEERSGKAHVLSEDQYEVEVIFRKLRETIKGTEKPINRLTD